MLLSSEETVQYETVLRSVVSAAENFRIQSIRPERIMKDFELAIMNACANVFPVSARFFHLNQPIYNNFRLAIGKHHPDLYSALGEFQK